MSDIALGVWTGLGAAFILVCISAGSLELGRTGIAADCQRLGRFVVDGKVFDCKETTK